MRTTAGLVEAEGGEPSRTVSGGLLVSSHRARCSSLGKEAGDLEGEVTEVGEVHAVV